MYYFIYGEELAAVEDAEQAAKFKAAGWRQVTDAEFCNAWRERDLRRLPQLKKEKQVGGRGWNT